MKTYKFVATCLFGLEKLLGEEIDALGYKRLETIDGRVSFEGTIDAIARCNINLRVAERVYILVGSFPAPTFDALFEGTKALMWDEWILEDDEFPVTGHSVKSKLTSIPDCQKIVKKAVVDSLGAVYGIERFSEEGSRVRVEFFILNDIAHLMIDTSGVPLFKRGYRTESNAAPLRETLAAALVKLSRPRENVLTWDPFCGSGTIPIEAAMQMTNTAPGLNREFAAEDFYTLPMDIWTRAREEARDNIVKSDFIAYASDIDPKCIEITEANIRRAGMERNVKFFVRDALEIEKGDMRGTIVCNPPYG
ncbi:MAG: class I SAM-dependent RNA methyltransferase, partial [Ruminococcaceae bacterium]|nr:class I SAM-dependent RNA methyltransferase [Oscillospiraceae bacterium]